jgi:hypothetical protein
MHRGGFRSSSTPAPCSPATVMSKIPFMIDSPTGISNSIFETMSTNRRIHSPCCPLRMPMQVRWRIPKQEHRMLISRFQSPAFTPVYRCWKNALGVPLRATIRDARRALDRGSSPRMSFHDQQFKLDLSSTGGSRSLVAPGAEESATIRSSRCSLPQVARKYAPLPAGDPGPPPIQAPQAARPCVDFTVPRQSSFLNDAENKATAIPLSFCLYGCPARSAWRKQSQANPPTTSCDVSNGSRGGVDMQCA